MVSTLANFNLINSNLDQTLQRTASDPVVSRDAQYYRDNIGTVTSIDDFMDNYRLFSYAMKAYGLEDMTYAKAFIKKVLESDLSDDKSFANQLNDERYRDFAAAFNFTSDGNVKTTAFNGQSSAQEDATIGLYTQHIKDQLSNADAASSAYKTTIANVTSVDDFLSNSSLVDYALKANGIDPAYYTTDFIRKVLTSDPSDPSSYANTLGNQSFANLAKAFNFQTDGSLPAGTPAQSAGSIATMIENYDYGQTNGMTTPQQAQDDTDYFTQTIGSVASVDDLLADTQLYDYVVRAFGFNPTTADRNSIRQALTSDPSDPTSFANTATGGDYAGLAKYFNFNADGSVPTGGSALSSADVTTVTDSYLTKYNDAVQAGLDQAASYYQTNVEAIASVDDLMTNTQTYNMVLTAYGLDPSTTSQYTVKQALTGNATPARNSGLAQLVAAFNFDSGGNATAPQTAQSLTDLRNTETAYAALVSDGTVTADQAKSETAYYNDTIGKITSVDDFLKDDRLVKYALTANGIDPDSVTTDQLRDVLTSDLSDPKSDAYSKASQELRDFAATFNFQTDGSVGADRSGAVQSMVNIVKTGDLYTRQTLEENEGDDNTGVRLALYFERKAPTISSAYDILADPALTQVVQSALGISSYSSAADIDVQASYIDSRIDIADFKDPDKLTAFIDQFAALYDLDNSSGASDPTVALFSDTGGSIGISADLLTSIAQS